MESLRSLFRTPSAFPHVVLALLFMLFLLVGCSFDNPGAPSWDVDFAVPLSEVWYSLDSLRSSPEDIAADGGGIDTTADGQLRFFYEEPIDSVVFADSLLEQVENDTLDKLITLGTIDIDEIVSTASLSLSSTVPNYNGNGYYSFMPMLDSSTPIIVDSLSNFREAHLVDPGGSLVLQVHNDNNIQWDSVRVTIALNEPEFPTVGTVLLRDIDPGEIRSQSLELANTVLKQHLVLFTEGGGPFQSVEILEGDGLSFEVTTRNLNADYYRGVITRQDPERDTTVTEFEERDWITEALVTRMNVQIHVDKYTCTEDSLQIVIPAITDLNDPDQVFTQNFLLAPPLPGQEFTEIDTVIEIRDQLLRLDLPEGYTTPDPGSQKLTAYTNLVVLSGGCDQQGRPLVREVTSEDSVRTNIIVRDYDFAWIEGSIEEEILELDETEVELDFWDDEPDLRRDITGNLAIEQAQLVIDLSESRFDIPTKIRMDLTAYNDDLPAGERAVQRSFERWIDPEANRITVGGFADPDSQLVIDLLNHFPNRIELNGVAEIGRIPMEGSEFDPYQMLTLHRDDLIVGKAVIEVPFAVDILQNTTLTPSVESLDEELGSGIREATLLAFTRSTVPVGARLQVLVGAFPNEAAAAAALVPENSNRYGIVTPIHIVSPELDPRTGRAVEARSDTLETSLTEYGREILSEDNLWMRQILTLDSTSTTARVYVDDGIGVSLLVEGLFRVNEEEE
ncbi:hypothetical protein GF324_06435 [bacterium]|nr:hypothetical protein [bacterium]